MHEKPRARKALKCLVVVSIFSCTINTPMGTYESMLPDFMLMPNKVLNIVLKYFSFSLVSYISNLRFYSTPVLKLLSKFYNSLDEHADILVNTHDRWSKVGALYSIG